MTSSSIKMVLGPSKIALGPGNETLAGRKILEIIVPFTTQELTQIALNEANKLVGELNGRIRVISIETVPMVLPLDHPPVSSGFLQQRLSTLLSSAPTKGEIYLVRDPGQTWAKLLRARSLIVIASGKRLWPTREERLAKLLERNGHEVVLIYPRKKACSM